MPTDFEETLDAAALAREMIFLRLRTLEGLSETDFRTMTGFDFVYAQRIPLLEGFIARGMMEYSSPYWKLTDRGMLLADVIARDLL